MKWPIILPLLLTIPIIVVSAAFDEDDMDMTELERARRTAFMLPSTFYGRRHYGFHGFDDEDDNDDVEMTRKKRFFYAPYAPKSWQELVSDPSEDEDIDAPVDDVEDFERKRRAVMLYPGSFWGKRSSPIGEIKGSDDKRRYGSPYLLPGSFFNNWKKRSSPIDEIKGSDDKRGSPYFFPLFHYNPSAYKRVSKKRSLLDAFTRDDPTAFGYDKREALKKSDIEDRRKKNST